jgi:hypothetical protein
MIGLGCNVMKTYIEDYLVVGSATIAINKRPGIVNQAWKAFVYLLQWLEAKNPLFSFEEETDPIIFDESKIQYQDNGWAEVVVSKL